jgi:flagellar hook-associated protein 3 FlgL
MIVTGAGIPSAPPTTIISIAANGTDITLSAPATANSVAGGTQLNFYTPAFFPADSVNVNINRSSRVALNYSGANLLLGGTPAAASQAAGPPPSNLPINIFGTIGELIYAIQRKDTDAIKAASSNLKAATDQINLAQTEYASRAIRLDSAQTMLTNNQNTLKNIVSNKQTLDTAKTIIQLQQQTTAYQAALQGTAKILPMSLMDYLK